jgi:TonB-linked SusC/RagA family outer membrane protein
MFPLWTYAQNVTVKGTVSDEGGPLIGATVKVKGATSGAVTDMDGNYSIQASPKQTLVFSYLGYETKEIYVGSKKVINVNLSQDQKVLNEVVVVGYGQMKRADVTGSVVSVNEKAIERSVPTSIDQVLQGRAAGVQIQANSGTPGANTSIRIRGINSLNATNQPIFVIDGVVIDAAGVDTSDPLSSNNPLATINPSDIVSMDVLKDASATAIYGARASNGVIMITTKRGKAGEATITYDGYVGWQEQAKKLDMMNLQQYATHHNARAAAGIVAYSDAFVDVDALGSGTDWQEALFRRALMTSHNISITGGSPAATYSISGGYLNQDGIAVGSGYKRLTLRGNTDAQVKKWLKASLSFSLTDSKQQVGANNNLIMNALESQPSVAVKSADGSYDGPDDVWMPVNAIALANMRENYNKKMNFRVNGSLEATLMKGLTFKTELSADYNLNKYYYYEPDYQFGVLSNDTRTGKWTKTDTKYWSWRNIFNYSNTFNKIHTVNLMVGQEMSHSHWESQASTATGFLSNSVHDISAGDVSSSSGTGSQVNNSLFSYFGRAFYSFDDRYLLTATLRRDGSSRFADGHRWGWFPSAALAWKITNEKFMKSITAIDNLKLRLGWGSTGNQNVSDYAYMALLASKSTPWGSGVLTANNANPDLKWETTDSYNVGLDLNMFHNRIEFIFDWYYKKTRDLLLQIPLPAYLGSSGNGAASNPWANVGSLRNTGVEMTLNTVNIDKGGFQWRSNFVFSLNRNKVLNLDTESSTIDKTFQVGSDVSTVTRTTVGQPIGQFWGYKVIGRFEKAEDFYYKDANGNVKAVDLPEGSSIAKDKTWIGDYIFEDINGDGKINNEDETFIGNPNPDFTFGIGNTFSWKGFDLTIFFSGSYGNDIINYNRRFLEDVRSNSNLLTSAANYAILSVIDPNKPTDDYRNLYVSNASSTLLPRLSASSTNANNRMSDLYVEDGSYIRLQNVSLSYTLPKSLVRKIKLENLKVYMNLQNVFTWTKYNGFDPEVGSMYGDALMTGLDYGRYPSPRIYTFGLNISF